MEDSAKEHREARFGLIDCFDGAAEKLSRVRSLRWDGEDAVRYNYLGVGTFVATDYLEPQVKLDYATGAGANRYAGWDRFGRIVDLLWQGYGAESSSSAEPPGLVHLQYGYDRASNRTHRADLVAQFYEKDFDELYEYDGLHRLKKFHRGRLAEGDALIESPTLQQGWRLDATGNGADESKPANPPTGSAARKKPKSAAENSGPDTGAACES